ncbi:hypothetical protein EB72_24885 [Mycobacterium sp. SWH-M1]|nr:hypothetical protein EB72_24885 [Mycobacterium sp. SWH-M1]
MDTMTRMLIGLLAVAGISLAPVATADPTPDDFENIYGLYTRDEQQEVWANGQRNCVTIDQAVDAGRVTTDAAGTLIDQYQAQGWDLESSSDIVWESVEGRCPEYLDAVKRAVRRYGDPS